MSHIQRQIIVSLPAVETYLCHKGETLQEASQREKERYLWLYPNTPTSRRNLPIPSRLTTTKGLPERERYISSTIAQQNRCQPPEQQCHMFLNGTMGRDSTSKWETAWQIRILLVPIRVSVHNITNNTRKQTYKEDMRIKQTKDHQQIETWIYRRFNKVH